MKKQALSFFFFIMLNLALAREGSSLGYKFSPRIETDLSKNRINYRSRTNERTYLAGEVSIQYPAEFAGVLSDQFAAEYNTEWYKIRFDYADDGKTGYSWKIPLSLVSEQWHDRCAPASMLCYGINSFDKNKGLSTAVRIIRDRQFLSGESITIPYSKISSEGIIRQSVITKDISLPGMGEICMLEFENPGNPCTKIFLLHSDEMITAAGKIFYQNSPNTGLAVNYSLS